MKFLASQLATFLSERQSQQNVRALLQYLAFLVAIVLLYAVLFHVIKANVEGESHSWVTGVYWTLTVMSTLGFGDITFQSDIGRVFSIVVLMSGIVLLLIVLPFVFIRHFYAPWLEAQVRLQAPRRVPPETSGHVLICAWDTIAPGLVERLEQRGIPYFVLEGDPARAATLRLNVIAIRNNGHVTTNIAPTHLLESGSELVVIGDVHQRHAFSEAFGRARAG